MRLQRLSFGTTLYTFEFPMSYSKGVIMTELGCNDLQDNGDLVP